MKIINFARVLLSKSSWFVGAFQAILIFVSFAFAWFLSSNLTLPNRRLLLSAACLLILIRMCGIAAFGLLHGWWRYTGLSDAVDVLNCVFSGTAVFVVLMRYLLRASNFPRTVYVLEPLLTAGILIGVRIFSRVLAESVRLDHTASKRVLLVGAGEGAQTVVREIGRPGSEYAPIGYVDDDCSKVGLKIEGIPVLGTVDELPQLLGTYPADEVLIAVPSASSTDMQRFVKVCKQANVKFRTVPALRDVIDVQSIRKAIYGRSLLVTGAAGSIGAELCRQILEQQPSTLVCVDRNETGMFHLDRELTQSRGKTNLRCRVADVEDRRQMECILHEHHPETIFHAAAYKHVPLMELNMAAAVENNVFGLMNLLEVASENLCERFVFISSDKAVNPSNVMGATKRIGELLIAHQPTNGMRALSVRFGNVLGSNGSVIPVLQQQLRNNEPLTVTDREIKRFFMTIREAVSFVLQASVIGEKGDTLVLDMGQPISIVELARTLIRLSGRNENQVPIEFTGLRQGEKLIEELFYPNEVVAETSFPKIKKARGPLQDWSAFARKLSELEAALFLNGHDIRAKISEIVPEFTYLPDQELKTKEEETQLAIGQD